MNAPMLQMQVQVEADADADAVELAELTGRLRRELASADVERVEGVSTGPPPEGTRGVDVGALGELLVTVAGSIPAIESAVQAIRGWLGRSRARRVVLQIGDDRLELDSATDEQQALLIRDWIKRHAPE